MHDAPDRTTRPEDFAPAFEALTALLGDRFSLIGHARHEHVTPWGSVQKFQFSTFRKRQNSA